MAYDAMPGFVWVIESDVIEHYCPDEYAAFMEAVSSIPDHDADDILFFLGKGIMYADPDEFGVIINDEYDVDITEETYLYLIKLHNELCEAFEEATHTHIELVTIDNEDEGSCYDEVSGAVWSIDATMIMPAVEDLMKQHNDKISNKGYCLYG